MSQLLYEQEPHIKQKVEDFVDVNIPQLFGGAI